MRGGVVGISAGLVDAVEREVEDVVVVQAAYFRALAILCGERPRQQKRHLLFAEPAMRTQPMSRQLGEIVILPARADHSVAVAEDREIPLAVYREIELVADLFFRQS